MKTVGKKRKSQHITIPPSSFLFVQIQFIYLTGDEEKDWASGKNVDRNVEYLWGKYKNKNIKKKKKRGEISRSSAIGETRVGSSHLSPHADEETFQVCHLFPFLEILTSGPESPTQRRENSFFFLLLKIKTNMAHISVPTAGCAVSLCGLLVC